jgi:hypothetical protein
VKGKLLEDYDSKTNEHLYEKDQLIAVSELDEFPDTYAVYRYDGLDWIPKHLVEILDKPARNLNKRECIARSITLGR